MQERKTVTAGMFSSIDVPNDFLSVLARMIAEDSIRNGIKVDCQISTAKDRFNLTEREIVVLIDNLVQLGIDAVPNKDNYYIPVDKRDEAVEHTIDHFPGIKTSSVKIAKMLGSRHEDLQEEIKKLKDQLAADKKALKDCNKFKSPQKYQTLWSLVDATEKRIKELEQSAKLAKAGFVYLPSSIRPYKVAGFLYFDTPYLVIRAIKKDDADDEAKLVIEQEKVQTEPPFEKEDNDDATSIIIQIKRDIRNPLPDQPELSDIGEKLLAMTAETLGDEDVGSMQGVKRFIENILSYIQQHSSDIFGDLDQPDIDALNKIIQSLREYNNRYKLNVKSDLFNITLPSAPAAKQPSALPEAEPKAVPVTSSLKVASTANPDKGIATALTHLERIAVLIDDFATSEGFRKSKSAQSALSELKHAVTGLKYFITDSLPYAGRAEKEAAAVTLQNIVKSLEGLRPRLEENPPRYVSSFVIPSIKKATNMLLTIEEE